MGKEASTRVFMVSVPILTKTIYFILSLEQNNSLFLFIEAQHCNKLRTFVSLPQTKVEDRGTYRADPPGSVLGWGAGAGC